MAILRVAQVSDREEDGLFIVGSEFLNLTSEEGEVINRQLMPLPPISKSTLNLQQKLQQSFGVKMAL